MTTRIVLFGAGGQVGSDILQQAEQGRFEIAAYTHASADITHQQQVSDIIAAKDPHIIINAAAYTRVDDAEDHQEQAYTVNETGSRVLAEACRDADIPLIHLSTDYVFDGQASQPYKEDDDVNPHSVYGASKLAGEIAIRQVQPNHIILRTSWVFGRYGANFVYTIARLAATRENLSVVADQTGCPTAAVSIANTLLAIADTVSKEEFTGWGTYHYCGAPSTSWHMFASAIIDQLKSLKISVIIKSLKAINTDEYPVKARRPQYSVLNCDKIRAVFGIQAPDWRKDLHEMMSDPEFSQKLTAILKS